MYSKRILLTALVFGTAVSTLAQVHSNAPTDKDYRLTIVSPADGASITGTDLTVVLSLPSLASGRSVNEKERKDVMTPTFQVWVDGKDYGNLPTGQNVFTTHDLSYGPHKITVAAKNTAGELVDRKEINVTTVTASSMTTHAQTEQAQPAAAPPVAVAAPITSEPVRAPAPPPAPATAPPASAPLASLPQTATSYPAMAVGGLGLLLAGLALSRRRSE